MNTMLERAARAVEEEGPVGCCSIDEDQAREIARAVLMAVMEPDEAALVAACEVGPDTSNGCFSYDDARTVYVAMIDAILNQKT